MNFRAIIKYLSGWISDDVYIRETIDGHTLIDGLILNALGNTNRLYLNNLNL